MPQLKKRKGNYFVFPALPGMAFVVLGMLLTILCTFKPDVVPYDYLGPVGDLARLLAYKQPIVMQTICYTALFMHFLEGCYSYYLSGMKELTGSARIKWLISTYIFGIFSMYYLLKYDPREAQKKE